MWVMETAVDLGLLTRLHLCDADLGVDELAKERPGERANSVLRRTVDTTAGVRLTTCNGSEVDDVARVPRLEVCSTFSEAMGYK